MSKKGERIVMVDSPFGPTLLSVWEDYRRCAFRSRQLKRWLISVRLLALTLLILGCAIGLLADQIEGVPVASRWLAGLSAVALALAAYAGKEALDAGLKRNWVLARSVAEALKSEAFKFITKAPVPSENQIRTKQRCRPPRCGTNWI